MSAIVDQGISDEVIDFRAIATHLLSGRWWIFACVLLSTAGFSAAAFLTKPVYRVTAVLAPANDYKSDTIDFGSTPLGGLASGLGLGPRDAQTEEALAVLRSRELTERFIMDKNLMPILFPDKWDGRTGTWKVDRRHRPTLARAYNYFDSRVRSITQDRKTDLITLQIDWTNRAQAAEWADELVGRLNSEMRERAITDADASLQFLNQELSRSQAIEVRDAISQLIENQEKELMLAHVTEDYSFRFVDRPIASDEADPIKPRKALLLVAGPLAGLTAGSLLAIILGRLSRPRADA